MSYGNGDSEHAIRDKRNAEKPISNGRGLHPNTLANLKRLTPETSKLNQIKAVEKRALNYALRQELKLNAKTFQAVMAELPQLSSLDVLRMAVHTAIAKDNWEDASRYAAILAEFEAPKLQRIESNVTTRTSEMSDEELKKLAAEEGLSL